MNTLYHYVHCPFCVRVRLALGLFNTDYKSIVLPYDDEETPIDLMGVKMLPIFTFDDGTNSNKSLDIIQKLDSKNNLKHELIQSSTGIELQGLLNDLGSPIHNLCMPYWIWTPEFSDTSRKYFVDKKTKKRGPFNKIIQNKDSYLSELDTLLINLEKKLTPFYKSKELTILDIMLVSHLWGMYIFPEFQFSSKIHNYLQSIKKTCQFNYHEDFWL